MRGLRGWRRLGAVCLAVAVPALGFAVTAQAGATGGAALAPSPSPAPARPAPARPAAVASSNPLAQRGMWIWELDSTDGGNLQAIIDQAQRDGIGTLMIKSSDGTTMWSQFNRSVVAALHAAHLKVCAWQYVYGDEPATEAELGARAVRDGADCLLIDAEGEYEGKYVSAQTYLHKLRSLIGPNYPVGLAGLPYIDYHPAFPYSVFLGSGGAQYDVPQMYWHDIGTTTDGVFLHTYAFNLLYGRPIFPLGQIYGSPPVHQVLRFRQLSRLNDAPGVSWWDWQEGGSTYFDAVSRPVGNLSGIARDDVLAGLGLNAEGDVVVWAQEHLVSAGDPVAIDGAFGPKTEAAVKSFQSAHGLPVTGEIDQETWTLLLRYRPATVTWVVRHKYVVATTSSVHGSRTETVPKSARLPDRGQEIPRDLGAGRPPGA